MLARDYTQLGYWGRGAVHAVDRQRMVTPCGLAVKSKKLKPQTPFFGTNCPQCDAFVKALLADENAKGLHDVRQKPEREQSALIIFKHQQMMTQDFTITPGFAHGVQRAGFGSEEKVFSLLFAFERSLSFNGSWPTDTSLNTARFLVFAAANDEHASDPAGEWSICRHFNSDGANEQAHTYWMKMHPNGSAKPEWMYQIGSC